MKIKAILFDIDNTLMDFMKMKHESCRAAMEAMIKAGLKTNQEKGLKVLYELYDKYGIEYQYIFRNLLKELGGKIDYRIIAYGIIAYRKMRENYLVPYAEVVPTLIELKKNYKLAIISDAPVLQAWMRLVTMNLDSFFDVVITKADARKQKTHPAPFKAALRELNINPGEAVMIGDRIARDVDTAEKLGIHAVYARYGDSNPPAPGKSGAEFEIDNIKELVKIVKDLENSI
jgi:putative hydrolase of the HAD superfamily